MSVERAWVAVGSNIRPEENIRRALRLLIEQGVRVTGSSTFYRSRPLERPDQEDFVNGVWRVETSLEPRAFKFDLLRPIEERLGRKREADKHAARCIDLDLILHGEQVIEEEGLRLPDPDIRARAFIAVPLAELDPELRLPDTGEMVRELSAARPTPDMRALTEFSEKLRGELRRTGTPTQNE
jgi:dihydroneopterin aldolase/2-amino-4-hydroxy-6-hydroxymethyldihydropteridine diphosphokinase